MADLPILCAHAVFPKLFRSFAFFASDLFRDQKKCRKRSEITTKPCFKSSSKTKGFQLRFFTVFGFHFKGPGGPSWRSLGTLGALLAVFWGLQIQFFSNHLSQMGSKRPFGSIWGDFGTDLGRFWEEFGGIWNLSITGNSITSVLNISAVVKSICTVHHPRKHCEERWIGPLSSRERPRYV